jgi:hypothetical protein
MVNVPNKLIGGKFELESIIVGILISDGWLQINKQGNTRLFFKQSVEKLEYFLYVFKKLYHFCSSYPQFAKTTFNGNLVYSIYLSTRSFPCFTFYYDMFYNKKVKIVPPSGRESRRFISFVNLWSVSSLDLLWWN